MIRAFFRSWFAAALILLTLTCGQLSYASGTINVWTDRPIYRVGDTVSVSFDKGGGLIVGSARIDITGPATITWGPLSLSTGGVYTAKLSGAAPIPGNYYVKVTLNLSDGLYEGTTSYQVAQTVPFDYSVTISPASVAVVKGDAAKYEITVKYSHPSYSATTISFNVTEMGPGMSYTLSKDDVLSIRTSNATESGTYTIHITASARGITRATTVTLVVQEPEAVLSYESISGIPQLGTAIYVGQNSETIVVVSNTGNAIAYDVSVVLEEVSPHSGINVTSPTLQLDIAPQGTGEWTIDVRGVKPGSYQGVLRAYSGKELVLERAWYLDVLGPEITVFANELPAEGTTLFSGDDFSITYTLQNTSPVDANNVSLVLFVHGLTIVQKPSITSVPSHSEVKAKIDLRSDVTGPAWLKVIVSSDGTVVYENTLDITVSQRPLWEQRSFVLVVVAGVALVATVVVGFRQRHRNWSGAIWPHKMP